MKADLERAAQNEQRLENELRNARSERARATAAFHQAILGAKRQVIAQYGDDSAAMQALGLKRKSDRKRPTRRATKSNA